MNGSSSYQLSRGNSPIGGGASKNVTGRTISLTQKPAEFALKQNYPNPFNPATTIKYELPVDTHVSLKLYDILGKEVLNLVNENKQAGYYQTELSAASLASGVYFYRLQAGGFVQTKKLVILR